jgi:hypothetical protein
MACSGFLRDGRIFFRRAVASCAVAARRCPGKYRPGLFGRLKRIAVNHLHDFLTVKHFMLYERMRQQVELVTVFGDDFP